MCVAAFLGSALWSLGRNGADRAALGESGALEALMGAVGKLLKVVPPEVGAAAASCAGAGGDASGWGRGRGAPAAATTTPLEAALCCLAAVWVLVCSSPSNAARFCANDGTAFLLALLDEVTLHPRAPTASAAAGGSSSSGANRARRASLRRASFASLQQPQQQRQLQQLRAAARQRERLVRVRVGIQCMKILRMLLGSS